MFHQDYWGLLGIFLHMIGMDELGDSRFIPPMLFAALSCNIRVIWDRP